MKADDGVPVVQVGCRACPLTPGGSSSSDNFHRTHELVADYKDCQPKTWIPSYKHLREKRGRGHKTKIKERKMEDKYKKRLT